MKKNRLAKNKEILHKTHLGSVSGEYQFRCFPVY
ncbi:hypothetical protein T12_1847 [Trichinella patagoniensis]|uniref:Uncharacterized protein n=1 Tax=Trichinella patagoniensis TaxID=990121 RepID=A0A0V0XUV6_9BILA|nr:hypothetical protein T12_7596 [Trichinella patagoniensis]KRX91653.1 hypothetical protein T12_2363 [Trichinella patagoniensis]KRY04612.1 hypothetical protein T12_1847 [Trichinella patagoniensis]